MKTKPSVNTETTALEMIHSSFLLCRIDKSKHQEFLDLSNEICTKIRDRYRNSDEPASKKILYKVYTIFSSIDVNSIYTFLIVLFYVGLSKANAKLSHRRRFKQHRNCARGCLKGSNSRRHKIQVTKYIAKCWSNDIEIYTQTILECLSKPEAYFLEHACIKFAQSSNMNMNCMHGNRTYYKPYLEDDISMDNRLSIGCAHLIQFYEKNYSEFHKMNTWSKESFKPKIIDHTDECRSKKITNYIENLM